MWCIYTYIYIYIHIHTYVYTCDLFRARLALVSSATRLARPARPACPACRVLFRSLSLRQISHTCPTRKRDQLTYLTFSCMFEVSNAHVKDLNAKQMLQLSDNPESRNNNKTVHPNTT